MLKIVEEKDVLYISSLSKIEIDEDKMEIFTKEFNKILDYMDKLNELDTEGVEPTSHVLDITNVFRKDVPYATSKTFSGALSRDEALKNAPEKESGHFKVPIVIEN